MFYFGFCIFFTDPLFVSLLETRRVSIFPMVVARLGKTKSKTKKGKQLLRRIYIEVVILYIFIHELTVLAPRLLLSCYHFSGIIREFQTVSEYTGLFRAILFITLQQAMMAVIISTVPLFVNHNLSQTNRLIAYAKFTSY